MGKGHRTRRMKQEADRLHLQQSLSTLTPYLYTYVSYTGIHDPGADVAPHWWGGREDSGRDGREGGRDRWMTIGAELYQWSCILILSLLFLSKTASQQLTQQKGRVAGNVVMACRFNAKREKRKRNGENARKYRMKVRIE